MRSFQAMVELPDEGAPEEPVPPEDSMCCGSGCEFCVWTTYFAELAAYRQALADWQARQTKESNGEY